MKTQEEIEELAKNKFNGTYYPYSRQGFIEGYTQCQEDIGFGNKRIYNEEDMQEYAEFCIRCNQKGLPIIIAKDWFEQFAKI